MWHVEGANADVRSWEIEKGDDVGGGGKRDLRGKMTSFVM